MTMVTCKILKGLGTRLYVYTVLYMEMYFVMLNTCELLYTNTCRTLPKEATCDVDDNHACMYVF